MGGTDGNLESSRGGNTEIYLHRNATHVAGNFENTINVSPTLLAKSRITAPTEIGVIDISCLHHGNKQRTT